ncbi:MAG: hypothetical protein PHD67_08920, partial [Oscillospiraceae bacterium]|nr:hypothetical protein [Oscillospiraceae bacterium]
PFASKAKLSHSSFFSIFLFCQKKYGRVWAGQAHDLRIENRTAAPAVAACQSLRSWSGCAWALFPKSKTGQLLLQWPLANRCALGAAVRGRCSPNRKSDSCSCSGRLPIAALLERLCVGAVPQIEDLDSAPIKQGTIKEKSFSFMIPESCKAVVNDL